MYLLLFLLCTFQPPQKGSRPPSHQFEIPSISATSALQSAEYVGFLLRLYVSGIKANPKENATEYANDIAKLARVYNQLSITWEGTATVTEVPTNDGFPKESRVLIRFAVSAFMESKGALVDVTVSHNDWTKKIRPNTKVVVKAFIEEIRYHNGGYVVILSKVTLVDRKP